MASLTLKESFKGAFMTDNMVTVEFSGIPEGATLAAMVTSNLVATTGESPVDDRAYDSLRYGGCSKRWIRHGDARWSGA